MCLPRAERTATTFVPASFAVTMRWAARLMRSASATDVPPNFMTTVSEPGSGMTGNDSFPPVPAESARRRLALAVLAAVALVAVAAGVVVGAGHGDGGETASDVPSPGRGAPKEHISFLAKIVPPPAESQRGQGSPVPKSVADLARRLPLERKVAQLFVLGLQRHGHLRGHLRPARAARPGRRRARGRELRGRDPARHARERGGAVAREHHHVPPWVFASQEGGELNSFPDLPPTAAPADLSSAREAASQARASAKSLLALGINARARAGRGRGQLGDRLGARLARVLGLP